MCEGDAQEQKVKKVFPQNSGNYCKAMGGEQELSVTHDQDLDGKDTWTSIS